MMTTPKLRVIPSYKELILKAANQTFDSLMGGGDGRIDCTIILFCYDVDKKQCEQEIEEEVQKLRKNLYKQLHTKRNR